MGRQYAALIIGLIMLMPACKSRPSDDTSKLFVHELRVNYLNGRVGRVMYYKMRKRKMSAPTELIKTGVWKQWYPNGNMLFQGEYREGKKQGTWTVWNINGQIITEGQYESGLRTGDWKKYEAGNIVVQGQFANDKAQGLWKYMKSSGYQIDANYVDDIDTQTQLPREAWESDRLDKGRQINHIPEKEQLMGDVVGLVTLPDDVDQLILNGYNP